MAGESNKTVWIVLATVLLAHVMLAALPPGDPPRTGLVRTLILDGLTPIEKMFDFTVNGVATVWNNYLALLDTRSENQRLQRENADLRMEIERNREEVRQAERLQRLLDALPSDTGRRVVARVIGSDPTPGRKTVTIDKGRLHGLFIDAPVMTPDGIVGRVIHTGHFAAIVQLISDPESGVGILVRSSRVQGIVRGDGRVLELDLIVDDTELGVGDELLTSGTDRIYPKGLKVGVIESIGPTEDLMKTARIRPAADLATLEEVLCLIDRPDTSELVDDPLNRPPA
jgi:rod shape-determining protein MreC